MKEEEVKEAEGERLEDEEGVNASGEIENFVSMKKSTEKEAYKVAIGESCLRWAQEQIYTYISRYVNIPLRTL